MLARHVAQEGRHQHGGGPGAEPNADGADVALAQELRAAAQLGGVEQHATGTLGDDVAEGGKFVALAEAVEQT